MIEITDTLIIVLLFVLLILMYNEDDSMCVNEDTTEPMVNIPKLENQVKWTRDKTCNFLLSSSIKRILDQESNITYTDGYDWNMYFTCGYNNIKRETDKAYLNSQANKLVGESDKRIFIIDNADEISSKHKIWTNLVDKLGRTDAIKIMPETYRLYNKDDLKLLSQDCTEHPNKIYILKRNVQRKKGLKITNNRQEILNALSKKFLIAQELTQNPYLIEGRKINLRFYILVVCQKSEVDAYVHDNGFMYYTKVPFLKGSLKDEHNITTGYIERSVYDRLPLTHEDFRRYLDNKNRTLTKAEAALVDQDKLSSIVFKRVYDTLSTVMKCVQSKIGKSPQLYDSIKFQLYGADIAINDDLSVQLMEINKGPDLGAKDKRDREVKDKFIRDTFVILGVLPGEHSFVKILE